MPTSRSLTYTLCGAMMKKKGPKSIPDFSSKRKTKEIPGQEGVVKPPAPVTTRNVKPPSTSAKSGRRGG